MRVTKRWIAVGAVSIVGAGVMATRSFGGSSATKVQVLTSEAFNNLFDQSQTMALLAKARDRPKEANVVLYRLLGCPYCARVKTVMDFLQIPYAEVLIDPISGAGIPDPRYPFAPQISLSESSGETTTANFIVDSAEIITKLGAVYNFERNLEDPRQSETRKWIADRFQGVTFAALNSSWWFAFYAYPDLVPPKYSNFVCRCIGSTALYALANFKILPKLRDQATPEIQSWLSENKASSDQAGKWILEESKVFTGKLQTPFHGGKVPDLADVEMFAVVRNVVGHSGLRPIIKSTDHPLGEWFHAMEPYANGSKRWPAA